MGLPFVAQLTKGILDVFKTTVRANALTVEDFKQILNTNIKFLEVNYKSMTLFSDQDLVTFYKRLERTKDEDGVFKVFKSVVADYDGKAKTIESRTPFVAARYTHKQLIKYANELLHNVDTLFASGKIEVNDITITNVMALGVMRQTYLYAKFWGILWSELIKLGKSNSDEYPAIKIYRKEFIQKNITNISTITNKVCNCTDRYSILDEYDDIKSQNMDVLLFANGSAFTKWVNPVAIPDKLGAIKFAIPGLNIITYMMKAIDDYQYNRYLELKDTEEWMQFHTATLRQELRGMDPESPEAKKLEAIIEKYDIKISEYDRKLNIYLEED